MLKTTRVNLQGARLTRSSYLVWVACRRTHWGWPSMPSMEVQLPQVSDETPGTQIRYRSCGPHADKAQTPETNSTSPAQHWPVDHDHALTKLDEITKGQGQSPGELSDAGEGLHSMTEPPSALLLLLKPSEELRRRGQSWRQSLSEVSRS